MKNEDTGSSRTRGGPAFKPFYDGADKKVRRFDCAICRRVYDMAPGTVFTLQELLVGVAPCALRSVRCRVLPVAKEYGVPLGAGLYKRNDNTAPLERKKGPTKCLRQ